MLSEKYTAEWCRYRLDFNFEARTSRGSMLHKDTYFIKLTASDGRTTISEVPLFKGLSAEDTPDFEKILADSCQNPLESLMNPPCSSIAFGFESAFANLDASQPTEWEKGKFGIPINGLIWMGDKELMRQRIKEKLKAGFKVLKLKIGGINFDEELELLQEVRKVFSSSELEIRLDANGSFKPEDAMNKLEALAKYHIHSIEQPIKAGQHEEMALICRKSPIPVALDEELIGKRTHEERVNLINTIKPHYIILKPALCGGFKDSADYAEIIGAGHWWATSALESNIGLFAIGRWLSSYRLTLPQGLGTGLLYTNNIPSPLEMKEGSLFCFPRKPWIIPDNLPWQH